MNHIFAALTKLIKHYEIISFRHRCDALSLVSAFAQDVVGKWKLENGTAIVEIYKSGKVYNGKIVWLKNPTEADGTPAVDDKDPNKSLRKIQLMGLNMLSNLKAEGKSEYDGGTIYDPNNGETYYCSLEVKGNTLKVRGSLDKWGLMGRTMNWYRVKE